jgi:F420-dependent oxidoreductase-like protein
VDVGVLIPQGWKREYAGWDPARAWARTVELARQAEELGFESEWVFDHFTTVPEPTDEITFESFSTLSALAVITKRVRMGHMVICTGFRNPALTAKLAATIDVISGGRFELGIGGGWKQDEWIAYGYGFPPIAERLGALSDHLEIIRRMLEPGRATYDGEYASVRGAINEPKGIQKPRIPIIVGGNGKNVTMRLAARHADELNFVFRPIDELTELIALAHQRCEEIDRDPATLRISLYGEDGDFRNAGQKRIDLLGEYAALGLDRLVAFPTRWSPEPETQAAFADDCLAAGLPLRREAIPVGA